MALFDIHWENDLLDTSGMIQVEALNEEEALKMVIQYSEHITGIYEVFDEYELQYFDDHGLIWEDPNERY